MALTVDVLSNAARNAANKYVIRPGLNNIRSNLPTRWGGQGPSVGDRASNLEKNTWSPYILNTQSFIEIYTQPDIRENFKGANQAAKGVVQAISKAVGWSYGINAQLGQYVESFVDKYAGNITELLSNTFDQDGYLSFKSFITKYPDLGVTNQYTQQNIIGKLTNFASNVGEAIGGLSPNMQLNFQIPKMWVDSTMSNIEIECHINAHTLNYMPVVPTIDVPEVPKNRVEAHGKGHAVSHPNYVMDPEAEIEVSKIDELNVMNAVLVALMIASPRQGGTSIKGETGGLDAILKSPAVVDIAINGILFPTMNCNNVNVSFGNVYGPFGFPVDAVITWSFGFPLMPSRENFNKLRNALYAYDPNKTGGDVKPQLSTDTVMLKTTRGNNK